MTDKKQHNQNAGLKTENCVITVAKTQDPEQETARRHDVRSEYRIIRIKHYPIVY